MSSPADIGMLTAGPETLDAMEVLSRSALGTDRRRDMKLHRGRGACAIGIHILSGSENLAGVGNAKQ